MYVYVLVGVDGNHRSVLGVYSSADKAREQRDYVDAESLGGWDDYLCIRRAVDAEADEPFGHTLETF
jgi:hypothetical protein